MKFQAAESIKSARWPAWFDRIVNRFAAADAAKGILSVIDQGVVSATAFFSAMLLARNTSPAQLGIYYVALNVVGMAMAVQGELISSPFTIYCPRKRDGELASYAGSMILHQLALTGLSLLALVVATTLFFWGIGPSQLAHPMSVLIFVAPFILFRAFIRQFSFAQLTHLPLIVSLDVGIGLVQILSILLLAQFGMLTASSAYIVMGVVCAVACLAWMARQQQAFRFSFYRSYRDWCFNWGFARWALASQLIGCSMPLILPGLLMCFCGSAETGVLAACFGIVGLCNTFVVGVANFLTAKSAQEFERNGLPGLKRTLFISVLVFLATLGAFAVFLSLTDDWLLITIYGSDYEGTALTTLLLVFASLANSMAVVAGNGLLAIERPRANMFADFGVLIPTLTVAVCLVPVYQGFAIGLAMLVGNCVGAAIRWETLRRCLAEVKASAAVETGGAT